MLHYSRINVSEGIYVNKTSTSKRMYYLSLLLIFKQKKKYQSSVCNGYYDVLIISIDINSNTISNTDGVDYYCIIIGIGN